ncbi:MAG TPA: hypothetical protein VN753_17705 [Terracidiphilus sp.]|nr:hypothetical protein [Terracidiphilus sp.]
MLRRFQRLLACAFLLGFGVSAAMAEDGSRPAATTSRLGRWEAGFAYNFVHSNAPPGGCGCFSMNGGSASLGLWVSQHWAAVGEVAVQHASNVNDSGQDLTLASYLFGPRLQIHPSARVKPFAQILAGAAHASGSYAPGAADYPGSPNAFAMATGAGLSVSLSSRLAIQAPEVDYYLTRFNNSGNDHQNNVRVSAGLTWRFGM